MALRSRQARPEESPPDARWLWSAAVIVLTAALFAVVNVIWVVGTGLIGLSVPDLAARADHAAVPAAGAFLAIGLVAAVFALRGLGKSWSLAGLTLVPFALLAGVALWRPLALLTFVPAFAVSYMFLGRTATLVGLIGTMTLAIVVAFWGPLLSVVGIGDGRWPDVGRIPDIAFLTLGYSPTTLWLLVFLTLFVFLAWAFLVPYVGDCARYLRDAPDNIQARNEIRKIGLQVLQDLHDQRSRDGTPRYDRIVVVAHSLGTIIAYDVLRAFFVEQISKIQLSDRSIAAFREVEALAGQGISPGLHGVAPIHGGLAWQPIDNAAPPALPNIRPRCATRSPSSPGSRRRAGPMGRLPRHGVSATSSPWAAR